MRTFWMLVLVVAFGFGPSAHAQSFWLESREYTEALPEPGSTAPHFLLRDAQGEAYSTSELPGPVVLYFWNSACPPCVGALPVMEDLFAFWREEGVAVWGLSGGEEPEAQPHAVAARLGATFPILLNADAVHRRYGVLGTPAVVVLARDGTVAYRASAADTPDIDSDLHEILDQLTR